MEYDKVLWLAGAGSLGTLARALLGRFVQSALPEGFPWGTLVVNLLGCFLFGVVWALGEGRWRLSPEVRLVVLTGFMGAFTTFSSFVFDTGTLLTDGKVLAALGNLAVQNAAGLALLFLGLSLGRVL